MNLRRMWTVARTDLKQLIQARDYWIPMVALGALFFLVVPAVLLLTIRNIGEVTMVQQISDTLKVLPKAAQAQIQGSTPEAKTSYALSVFLFAPIAVVVPLTISTAVGAATIVGERERGTGEFLAHSPATAREIYTGKLLASLIPGYLTTIVGLLARLQEVDVSDAPPDVAAGRVEALHDPHGIVAATDSVTNDGARPDEWSRWTAWDTAEAVRRGEVSALELTQAALARVAAVDGHVHAWLRLDEQGALSAARAVDAARARGESLGPLAGVPTALKDNLSLTITSLCWHKKNSRQMKNK